MLIGNLEDNVRAWMCAAKQDTPKRVSEMSPQTRELRKKLVAEEIEEFMTALDELGKARTDAEKIEALADLDDAICDSIYVLVGTAVSAGIPLEESMQRVCDSNDSKLFGGKLLKNEFGKVMKPDTFFPPKLEEVIEKHYFDTEDTRKE